MTEAAGGQVHRTLLGRSSAIYGLGSLLGMAGSLILLPFVTRALGPAAFGSLELYNRTADIAVIVGLLGMRQAFIRHFFDRDSDAWRARASSTTLIFALCVGMVALGCGVAVTLLLPDLGRNFGFGSSIGIMLAASVAAQFVFHISTVFLQVRNEALKFVGAQLAMMLLYVGAALLSLYVLDLGVIGVVLAHISASVIIAALCSGYLIARSGFAFDRQIFLDMLRFGAPFVPTTVLAFVGSSADRYVLASTVSLGELGIYSLAAKIAGTAMTLVATPLERVWAPFVFAATGQRRAGQIIGNAMFAYLLVVATVAVGVAVTTPLVFPLLAPAEFSTAVALVPLFCISEALTAASHITDTGILIAKRTWLKPVATGLSALISVVALLILVPRFHIYGAVAAVVLSVLARAALNLWLSNRCFRLDVPARPLLFAVLGLGGMLVLTADVLYNHVGPVALAVAGSCVLIGGLYVMRSRLHVGYPAPSPDA